MQTALHKIRYGDKIGQKAVASLAATLGQKPYITQTVRELLWGYDNPLLSLGKTLGEFYSPDSFYPFDKFGLFVGVM